MDAFTSFIFGIIEGITEFLPISSTGHLILATKAFGISHTEFQKSFEIIIQLGAIASVVVLYWKDFFNVEILKKIFVAFLPTAIIGLALYSFIKTYLLGNEVVVVWAMFLGGVALIGFELLHKTPIPERWGPDQSVEKKEIEMISYKQAALVGVAQAVAMIPGVSRSAATIIGGLLLGIKRVVIVEFSFLLAVPTMLAATGLDLITNASSFSQDDAGILAIGFITSFIVALLAIKFLLQFVRTHTFIPFGIYRIGLAILFWLVIL